MAINLIGLENFADDVIAEKKPVLLMIMPRDDQFPQQLRLMEEIAGKFGDKLKVSVLQEGSIEAFKMNYGFSGTPTFLILLKGKERGRMLGLADEETLTDLILHS